MYPLPRNPCMTYRTPGMRPPPHLNQGHYSPATRADRAGRPQDPDLLPTPSNPAAPRAPRDVSEDGPHPLLSPPMWVPGRRNGQQQQEEHISTSFGASPLSFEKRPLPPRSTSPAAQMAPALSVFSNLGGTAGGQVDVSRMAGGFGTQISPLQSANSPSSSPSSLAIPPSEAHSHLTSIRYLDKPVHTFDDPRGHYQLERRYWKGKEKERAEQEAAAQEEEGARTRRRRGMRVASSPGTPTVSIPIVVPRPPTDVSATFKAELDIYRATRPLPSAFNSQSSSHTTTTGVPVDGGRSRRVVDQNVLLSAAATSLGVFDYESMLDEDRIFDEVEPEGGSESGSGAGGGSGGAKDELVAAALELKLQDLIDAKEGYPDTAAFPLPGEDPSPSSSSNLPLVDVLNGEEEDPSTNTNTNGSASSSSSFDVTHLNPGPRVAASPLPSPVGVEEGGGEETVALVPIEWNGRGEPTSGFLQPSPSSLHPPTIHSNQLNSSTASSSSLVTTPHQPASPLPTTTSLAPASSATPTPTQPLSPARPRPRGIILQSPSRGHNPSPSPPPTAPLPPVPTTTATTQTATRRPVLRPTERVVVQGPNFGGSPDLAAAEPRGRGQVRMESERVTGSGAREESEEEREERIRRGREDRCERWRRGVEIGSGSWDEERRKWVGMVEHHDDLKVEELGDAEIVQDAEVVLTSTEEGEGGDGGLVDGGGGDGPVEAEVEEGREGEVQVGGTGLSRVVVGWFGGFVRR